MADSNTPGYFRIGHVVLDIPPTDIATNRVNNDDQVSVLRGSTPMFVKTGQARWDVTVRWKALRTINSDGTYNYSQWRNLRRIIAIFKVSPFVEVENSFLRQHFASIQLPYRTQRMAFALKQIRVDTNPDSTNMLDVTLTMTLFNYAPYSKDFGYVGEQIGAAVDAPSSSQYQAFIDSWIADNMGQPLGSSSPGIADWQNQVDGVLKFKWRKYVYIPFQSPQATAVATVPTATTVPPAVPPLTIPLKPSATTSKKTVALAADVRQLIEDACRKHGVDPDIAAAQCFFESGGHQFKDGKVLTSSTGAIGLFQILPSTAKLLGIDPTDPAQNVDGGVRYLAEQLQRFGNYPHALGAYNAGAGYIIAYRDGRTIKTRRQVINPTGLKTADGLPPKGIPNGEDVPLYVHTILTKAGKKDLLINTPIKSTDKVPPPNVNNVSVINVPDPNYLAAVTQAMQSLPVLPNNRKWFLDHFNELGAFFYDEQITVLASVDSDEDGDFTMFPNQISVVMVNNLPMIPLSAMQYPTYQHVGPTDTIITIGMNSVGEDGLLNEAQHLGVEALANMTSTLENQFHDLRTAFRAVSSIHRMQSVFMENKLLNLLGIRGTLVRGLNTETVPDTSNLVQATLLASQYENVFEETLPYQINGVSGSYRPIIKNILTDGSISKLSKEEQDAYISVKTFSDAWTSHNEQFLLNTILDISKEPLNFLTSVDTPPTDIWFEDRDNLFAALDVELKVVNDQGDASFVSTEPSAAEKLPGLAARRSELLGKPVQMTYADYFVLSQLPDQKDQERTDALRKKIEAKFASQKPAILEQMYDRLFDWELLTNPAFSRQATAITNSPAFKDRFKNTANVKGPSQQDVNIGHSCYKDLGLKDYNQDPAGYFVDYNGIVKADLEGQVTNILGRANQSASSVNETQTVSGPSKIQAGFDFVANGQGLPGNANSLIRRTTLPAYSMNTAFPTYKLMLIEEDNTGVFFAFDNFYSYASVMDIEIIKYRDKPDTAIIQITNLAHLLQHRLYDDTAAGKMERQADRFHVDPTGALANGETATGGDPTSGIVASKTAGGTPYQLAQIAPRKNMVEGRGETFKRVPLKFFALQTGSKIQVRMGYSNNPDALYPVFTGQVTQIDGDDVLTITCQSFMLELMSVPGTTVRANSRLGMNFASGGAAFGGWSLSTTGDTSNVMRTMLRSPSARHFGHWQIGGLTDKKIKGFTWLPLVGEAMEGSSSDTISKIGHLLQTGYDRSGENILVNSVINIDATKKADDPSNAARRTFESENPNWFLGTARYGIDKQSKRSIWDIIKDISRRYPHFNLMVRDYGYPFEVDSTLVFAHPLDWYYSRPPLYGDSEREKPNDVTQGQMFDTWWQSTGKAKWDIIWKEMEDLASPSLNPVKQVAQGAIAPLLIALNDAKGPMTTLASSGPEGFSNATDYLHAIITGADSHQNVPAIYRVLAALANAGNLSQGKGLALDRDFQALYREWIIFLQLTDPAANSSRLKPVRKYHLVDHNHIVHNSMKVEDQIYNAVKIDTSTMKFNQNIPDQHIRVLDVTDMIEDVENNVLHGVGEPLRKSYSQSFLREEVGKMYKGEIVLRGLPEIEPYDIILLNDMSTGIIGPVEVDTVIHSFNMENGYITIVKPRLMLIANETVSLGLIQSLSLAWSHASANVHDLGHVFNPFDPNTTLAAKGVEVGLAAGALIAAGAAFAWAPPVGITLVALGLLAGYGILTFIDTLQEENPFMLMPLSRFGRPWLGGLQGFAISNFAYSLGQKFRWFDAEEIAPTIESWNELMHWRLDQPPQP